MMRLLAGAFLALWLSVGCAWAQENTSPNYERWADVATRAEETLSGALASDLALNALRSELVRFRGLFSIAQTGNGDRIRTATEQLATLGPKPEGTEPTEIAVRRAELNEQLATLRAPVVAAEEAFRRANGLIREIDKLIRTRNTDRLLERGPSPLAPSSWRSATSLLSEVSTALRSETKAAVENETERAIFRNNLPGILVFTVLGALLIAYARKIAQYCGDLLGGLFSARAVPVSNFLASLLAVAFSLLGVQAFVEALTLSALLGFRWAFIVEALPLIGLVYFGARWISGQVFPRVVENRIPLRLNEVDRAKGRRAVTWISLMQIALILIDRLDRFDDFGIGAEAVLTFPILAVAAYFLVELAKLCGQNAEARKDAAVADGDLPGRQGTLSLGLMRAGYVIGVVGVVAGAIGFMQAGIAMVFPASLTLGLLASVWLLQRLVGDLFVALTGEKDEAREGLIPVLIGLALVAGALPMLALIWGARWVELSEIWSRLAEGVSLGDTRISVSDFLTFIVVFVVGYLVTRALQATLRTSVLPKTQIEKGASTAIVAGIGYVGVFLAALIAITTTGIDLSSLAIVAGALSVGIGFGLQNIVSNFVSGIILLIERPISEGDWIEVGGSMGYVKNISVRSTRIETFDRTDVIVPNLDLVSGAVTNWTRGNTIGRVIVSVGVAYGTDTKMVETILLEIANAQEHVLQHPAPSVVFQGFGADSMDFEIRAFLKDVNWILSVKSNINHEIARRFAEEGVEIPFAQRDVWLRNPEALRGEE